MVANKFYGDKAAYQQACSYVDEQIVEVKQEVADLSTRVDNLSLSGTPDRIDGGSF